jgi:hypothetical protein
MAKKINGFDSISAAFAQSGTALAQLRIATGADRIGRHDYFTQLCGTIAALALCQQPPKGIGNAADHTKVAAVFTDAKMPRYAEALVGLSVALKRKGFRSIPEWDDALLEGFALVDGMLCHLRPKAQTPEALKAAEERKAQKAAERAAEEKAAEEKAAEEQKAALVAAEAKGFERATVEATKAESIVALIKTGQFSDAELALISEAIASVRQTVAA